MARSEARKLLLFDIDGTLLTTNGASRRFMDEALKSLFGPQISSRGVEFSGRTDLSIMEEILQRYGLPEEERPRLIRKALQAFVQHAEGKILPEYVSVLPGVQNLLERLHRTPRAQLGLVTGNMRSTAYMKLAAAKLDTFFPFGAFGSDYADRNLLPKLAVHRAYQHTGQTYSKQDVAVIGDSVHDVLCGHFAGAVSVAVASGQTSIQELAAHNPQVLLQDLSDADTFCSAILT